MGLPNAQAAFELRARTRHCAELVPPEGLDVVDIGCSFGWYARYAVDHGAVSVAGVDPSPEAVALARTYVPEASFHVGSALALPVPDGSADLVTMFDVIEHVPRHAELSTLEEAGRVLRSGGRLALTTPHHHPVATLTDPAWYLGHRHYTRSRVRELMEAAGFSIETMSIRGRLFDQVDLLTYYASRHLFGRERHPFGFVRSKADAEWLRDGGWNTLSVIAIAAPGR